MIYIDDFLTRRYWDEAPYPHGMGTNIPLDYDEMKIADELSTLKAVHSMRVPIMLFVMGKVLDMKNAEVQEALSWVVENNIMIAGHGYFHTESEYRNGYEGTAEKTLKAMKRIGQTPPYFWRFPRHEEVNKEYIESVGFQLAEYDHYLDPELNERRTLDVLRGHEHHNAWVHSVYLTRAWQENQKEIA